MDIREGDTVIVRTALGEDLERRALSGEVLGGSDFKIVWVCRPEEWTSAQDEGREPEGMPWPAEAVRLANEIPA
jgi:hypothetical protein